MSTEINPPDTGLACPFCWGASGLPFGAGFPPDRVLAQFTGIEKGDLWLPVNGEPPNGTYLLVQDTGCKYALTIGVLEIELEYFAGATHLEILKDSVIAFLSNPADICQLNFIGDDPLALERFKGGIAIITL